jgi:voltage-gated potassium channel
VTAAPPPKRPVLDVGIRPVVVMAVRLLVSAVAVLLVYYLVPVQVDPSRSDIPFLILHIALFAVIAGVQVPAITRSKYPGMRAMEATVLTVLIYVALFARIYLSASAGDHAAFSVPLNHNTALYFTVTVFATVGFGDVVATTEPTQLLVTVQMLLNLVVLGVVINGLFTVGKEGMARKVEEAGGVTPRPGPDR